jgi:hypothetical protein
MAKRESALEAEGWNVNWPKAPKASYFVPLLLQTHDMIEHLWWDIANASGLTQSLGEIRHFWIESY